MVDEVNHLQRFAFLISSKGTVVKAPMSSGKYIDMFDAMEIVEKYQNELNDIRGRLAQYENMEKKDV